jgi:hypothetical protein
MTAYPRPEEAALVKSLRPLAGRRRSRSTGRGTGIPASALLGCAASVTLRPSRRTALTRLGIDDVAITSKATSLHLEAHVYPEVADTVKAGLPCLTMTDSLDTSRQHGERYFIAWKGTTQPNAWATLSRRH